jgi:hypothetical protein
LFASAPVVAVLPAAAMAASAELDPIFAAIERHKKSWDRFGETCALTDEVAAANDGRAITDADRCGHDAASQQEGDAPRAFIETSPQTGADLRVALRHAIDCGVSMDPDATDLFFEALLKSPLLAV